MQIDMHYYGTYALARTAGLTGEAARIIATSAQFVDDNAQQDDIDFENAASCSIEATAHHTTSVQNLDNDDQRKVWVPFHFLPGNEGESFTERLICRTDSLIAQEMRDNHITQSRKAYYLELVGIMAHVYADTFAHYGFSGVSSRQNKVNSDSFEFRGINNTIRNYIVSKKDSFLNKFSRFASLPNIKSTLAQSISGALGHGGVVTFPDRPYLTWRFDYNSGRDSGWRNNSETFLEFSQKIHSVFTKIAKDNPKYQDQDQFCEWDQLESKVHTILTTQGTKDERINKWKTAAEKGDLFNHQEAIPVYQDWNANFDELGNDIPETQ